MTSSPGEQLTRSEQRMTALEYANEIRLARARARRAIRPLPCEEGKAQLARLLIICPHWLSSEPIHLLLTWPRRMGPRAVGHLLAMIDAHGVRPVGSLTERQRKMLADELSKPIAERPLRNLSSSQRRMLAEALKASSGGRGR